MQLLCQNCGQPILADNINIALGIAKCGACGEVFNITDELSDDRGAQKALDVPMPRGIRVETWGPDLVIIRRWFSLAFLFLVFFCVAWDSFLVFWYSMALRTNAPLMMIVFPIGHLAVGVGLSYYTLAGFINSTLLRVSAGELTIRHKPLPWLGNRCIATADVEQIYCTEHHTHNRNGGENTTYRVNARLKDGRQIRLLSGLTDADQGLFIEQTIERQLGITDISVRGEMER